MTKHDRTELPSIDHTDLSGVTGGTHRPGHTSGSDPQVTAALASITDSLKSLGTQNNNSSNSLTQLLPFLMLAKGGAGGGCPGGSCCR
jgi:hypothetical protein